MFPSVSDLKLEIKVKQEQRAGFKRRNTTQPRQMLFYFLVSNPRFQMRPKSSKFDLLEANNCLYKEYFVNPLCSVSIYSTNKIFDNLVWVTLV